MGIVVVILVVSVIGYLAQPVTAAVNVTEIAFQSSDNACGLANSDWEGFGANVSQVEWLAFSINYSATSACNITSVASATSGFLVSGADVPLTVPANTNETLQFNVTCPSTSYSGVLTVALS